MTVEYVMLGSPDQSNTSYNILTYRNCGRPRTDCAVGQRLGKPADAELMSGRSASVLVLLALCLHEHVLDGTHMPATA